MNRFERLLGILCRLLPVLACLFTLCQAGSCCAEESRIWSDRSGKHQIRAKLVDLKDGIVRLERPNGSISKIPLGKAQPTRSRIYYVAKKTKNQNPPLKRIPNILKVGDTVEVNFANQWYTAKITSIDYQWNQIEARMKGKPAGFTPTFELDAVRFANREDTPIIAGSPPVCQNIRSSESPQA